MLRERRFPEWLLSLEESSDGDLAVALAALITEKGGGGAAEELGAPRGNLNYWMGALGLATAFVALAPGDVLEIRRRDGTRKRIAHKGINGAVHQA